MPNLARHLGLALPLVASLALPAWAAGPVGLGFLKMGMSRSAVEQGDTSGAIKLLGSLQSFTLKSGVVSVRWKDDESSTATDLNLVHYQSCPSNLSSGMASTQPSRSL